MRILFLYRQAIRTSKIYTIIVKSVDFFDKVIHNLFIVLKIKAAREKVMYFLRHCRHLIHRLFLVLLHNFYLVTSNILIRFNHILFSSKFRIYIYKIR